MRVDAHGIVESIVHLGQAAPEARNLLRVVGKHEAYAGSAVASYERGAVPDWVELLNAPTLDAVYHDRFEEQANQLAKMLEHDESAQEVIDMLLRAVDEGRDDDVISQLRSKMIGEGGAKLMASTKKMVEAGALDFLRKNKVLLPRYLLPERGAGKK